MLKKFEVQNFMGFKDNFVFDLTTNKKYAYNSEMVEKGTIKKALIFGSNSSGKSNLCSALMDITFHIVDKEKIMIPSNIYLNANNNVPYAIFKYHFQFGKKRVVYEYAKKSCLELCYEKLYINEDQVLEYNYFDYTHNFINLPGTENLNKIQLQQQLSMIKYIYSNTVQDEKSDIKQLVEFVNGMLYFKSLLDGNRYMGYRLGSDDLASLILSKNKLSDFQSFLRDMCLNYNLVPMRNIAGFPAIGIKFSSGKIVEFSQVISSGTKTLWLFYCWLLEFSNLKFLIIDEFDAYYHYDLSFKILKLVNRHENLQSVLTTHTTFLMRKEVTRPDCCFIIKDSSKISPICKLTNKEIRDSNNIEKMYRDGEFIYWN